MYARNRSQNIDKKESSKNKLQFACRRAVKKLNLTQSTLMYIKEKKNWVLEVCKERQPPKYKKNQVWTKVLILFLPN